MKTLGRGWLVFLLAAAAANAQFEGVADMKIATTGKDATSGTGKIYLSALGWRTEVEMPGPEGEPAADRAPVRVVYLERANDPGTIFKIDETKKTYAVLHARRARTAISRKRPPEESIVKTAGQDTVAGLPCTNVQVTRSRSRTRIDACIWEEFTTGNWLRPLLRRNRPGADFMTALEDAGLEGSPVRLQATEADGSGLTVEVTNVARRQVPASTLEVPAGYARETVAPSVARMPVREEPVAMEDAERQIREVLERGMAGQSTAMEPPMNDGQPD